MCDICRLIRTKLMQQLVAVRLDPRFTVRGWWASRRCPKCGDRIKVQYERRPPHVITEPIQEVS